MTPLENELLHRLGVDYLQSLAKLSIFVFFYGVFGVLFSASVFIFAFVFSFAKSLISQQAPKLGRRRGFSNRATAVVFIATIINFILSSLNTGIQVALFIVFVRKVLILDIDYPLSEKTELADRAMQNLNTVGFWAGNIPFWLSDFIVIWRAWALFPERQWVILIPFILWIGTMGIFIGVLIWISIPNNYDQLNSNLDFSLTVAGGTLSAATNAVTTLMIAYKLWSHRTWIVKTLGLSRRKSPVQAILILLIESGLVYLVIQIAYLVLPAAGASILAVDAFQAVAFSLGPMYPTLVVVLVETQRSMMEICDIIPSSEGKVEGPVGSEAHSSTLGRLSFAVGSVRSVTDNEAEYQCSLALRSQAEQERGLEVVLEESQVGISG